MNNTIVIVGRTNAGKSTLAKALESQGYKKIVTYTTRPKRLEELNGIDYHFITKEDFKQKFVDGFFAEIDTFRYEDELHMYGSSNESYLSTEKQVIVLTPSGVVNIPIEAHVIYLDLSYNVLLKRAKTRGESEMVKTHQRLRLDHEKFELMELIVEPTIHVKLSTTTEKLVTRINKLLMTPSEQRLAIKHAL